MTLDPGTKLGRYEIRSKLGAGGMEKAYDDRAGWMINLNVDPIFDPIRSDPRFTALVKRMKLSS